MDEIIPCKYGCFNSKLMTFDHTYYFSHATGERKKLREKARETLSEPKKLIQNSIGYNFDVTHDLKYRGSIKKVSRRDAHNPITVIENLQMKFKVLGNILSIIEKIYFDNFSRLDFGVDYLNNRLNPNMNNLMAIDFAVRDWIDDTDLILSRATEEFPRLSSEY
jgi:hypothetical protein